MLPEGNAPRRDGPIDGAASAVKALRHDLAPEGDRDVATGVPALLQIGSVRIDFMVALRWACRPFRANRRLEVAAHGFSGHLSH